MSDFQQEQEEDISAFVAEVFGMGEAETPTPPASEPSVGTEGAAAGEGGSPAPDPAAATPPAEPAPAPGSAPAAPAPGDATPPAPQPSAPAATPEAPDPRDLQIQSLQATVNQLLEASKAKPAETPPPAAGQQDGEAPAGPKPINVQLPNELCAAIFGEDATQAQAGLNALVSGLATSLTHGFDLKLQALRTELTGQVQGISAKSEAEQLAEVQASQREDYFKAFPAHNKPTLLPIIAQEAAKMAVEFPNMPWNEDFRNALGTRVTKTLTDAGWAGGSPTPADPAPAAPATPAPPAAFLPQGSRPAPAEPDVISDLFSDF